MVTFTRYLPPDGHREQIWIARPGDIEKMAHAVIAQGAVFEVEVLSIGLVSMTCEIGVGDNWKLLASAICGSAPPVVEAAIDKMVHRAFKQLELGEETDEGKGNSN